MKLNRGGYRPDRAAAEPAAGEHAEMRSLQTRSIPAVVRPRFAGLNTPRIHTKVYGFQPDSPDGQTLPERAYQARAGTRISNCIISRRINFP
jgi:hypothetical protein